MNFRSLTKIGNYEWEISKSFRKDMRVPVRIFTSEQLLLDSLEDNAFDQAVNVACLRGLRKYVSIMPDVHQGYGFPIGAVAAVDYDEGVISPGGIGYDINCGIRLLASAIHIDQAASQLEYLSTKLFQEIPAGVGKQGSIKINRKEISQICEKGSSWAVGNGFASQADIELTESRGCLLGADLGSVSERAIERGLSQVGSLGSGNHFVEIDLVEQISDENAARVMGLAEGFLALQIHSGSRGFGHQICSDFVGEFQSTIHKYRIAIPDRELVCAPIYSEEGQRYLSAMRCAANFAFCNRQLLTFNVRRVFEQIFAEITPDFHLWMVYDLAHNIGKVETYVIDGRDVKLCVHRKGATRAFGPGHKDLPQKYRKIGQPVLVPGSMGTSSWVMVGTQDGMDKSFGSCCHGAGRVMSRSKAKSMLRGDRLLGELEQAGILVKAGSMPGLAEEAPQAYKDVDLVIESAVGAGIARKVARLKPLVVIKG